MRRSRPRRGQALTELALVLPLLVTIMLFGLFFAELVRAKLKLLEATRFTAWEMTSYVLDDYGSDVPNHGKAFAEAKGLAITDALTRYSDLDSVMDRAGGSLVAGYTGLTATMENQPVVMNGKVDVTQTTLIAIPPATLSGDAAQAHALFKFNQKGKVQVEMTVRLDNRILPRHFLDDGKGFFTADQWGGSTLQNILLRSRFTMIASGWQLPDGADAEQTKDKNLGEQAGVHRGAKSIHGMWLQVNRMTHLTARPDEPELIGLKSIDVASFLLPKPYNSTFVTSHNYGLPNADSRGCDRPDGDTNPSHPAYGGMNNLLVGSELDHDYRKCYDTAPFRDQQSWDASMTVQQFKNRGVYFMGCMAAQADDPAYTKSSPRLVGDLNKKPIDCGGVGP